MSAKAKKASTSAKKKKEDNNHCVVPFVSSELLPQWMNQERTKILFEPEETKNKNKLQKNDDDDACKCVYYWMQRDIRTQDNWALLLAQHLAQTKNIPLQVVYVLPCPFLPNDNDITNNTGSINNLPPKVCEMKMTKRHGTFLLGGLQIIEQELKDKHVPFHILQPKSHSNVGETFRDFVMGKSNDNDGDDGDARQGVASVIVCDMNPLRQYRNWVEDQVTPLMKDCDIPVYQVDAQ